MATAPFLGEVRQFSFPFAPKGWALCNGQTLAINQNQALYSILGVTYGGNGITTFNLPNLQGLVPLGFGTNYNLGQTGGSATVSLAAAQIPLHAHAALGSTGLSANAPGNTVLPGTLATSPAYTTDTSALVPLAASTVVSAGGSQPHENRQPTLTVNFCIALTGIYPSRN